MHTEDEAKELWCPFVRRQSESGPYNMYTDFAGGENLETCIVSKCMAWRWESTGGDMARQATNPGEDRAGYCGLAGKP